MKEKEEGERKREIRERGYKERAEKRKSQQKEREGKEMAWEREAKRKESVAHASDFLSLKLPNCGLIYLCLRRFGVPRLG